MTRSRIWTIGTAVVVVVVLAAGWFLLVSPTRAKAADVKEETASQEAANAQLASSIEQLKIQAQDLPAQEAKIAEFRQRIPSNPQLPSFIRQLSEIAHESNVVLVSMEPSTPAALTVQAPTTVTPQTGDASGETTTVPLNQTVASPVQYVQSKVTITGGYFNTEQFLTKLEKLKRSFLVTGFDITVSDDTTATPGDVTTNLQVRVFYAKDLTAAASSAAATLPSTAPSN